MPSPRHLYVHIPFCARRCSYCDFAIAVRRRVPTAEFVTALGRELSLRWHDAADWSLDTVYLGGGTPSRLSSDGVARVLELVRAHAATEPECEVTLEANPDDVSADMVRSWRESGVNRLSVGAQSFHAGTLRWMHRTHTERQIGEAIAVARDQGIENISLDLIFGVPPQLGRVWEDDLTRALDFAPSHVSVYGLTVEPGTALERWRQRGERVEAPEAEYEEEFLVAHSVLTSAGYEHYEVSNYALPGRRSRHNSAYWQDLPYAGVGPSAHSFDGRIRRWNVAPYVVWTRIVGEGRDPVEAEERLTSEQRSTERIYLSLRTADGLAVESRLAERLRPWVEAGWATLSGGRLRLTATGWLRLDDLAASLTLNGSCS